MWHFVIANNLRLLFLDCKYTQKKKCSQRMEKLAKGEPVEPVSLQFIVLSLLFLIIFVSVTSHATVHNFMKLIKKITAHLNPS